MAFFGNIFKNLAKKATGRDVMTSGPLSEANSGWVDPKPFIYREDAPYAEYYDKGIFESYGGELWVYFGFPDDVKIEWTKDDYEAVLNQHFFVDVVNDLGRIIDNQTERARNDYRTKFHLQITKESVDHITPPADSAPAYVDYLDRMSNDNDLVRPKWHGYAGVRLHSMSPDHEAYGASEKMKSYLEYWSDQEHAAFNLFEQNLADTVNVMTENGFKPLDFIKNPEDFSRLTAWYGEEDDKYGIDQRLETTRFQVPIHGKSAITPRWGEVTAHALVPKSNKKMFMVDPASRHASRWGTSAMDISANTVCINIRGEIRSPRVMSLLFEDKSHGNANRDDHKMNRLAVSKELAEDGHAGLDNVEIVVFSQVQEGRKLGDSLKSIMGHHHGLQPRNLVNRQEAAIMTTIPTYPKPIARIPKSNFNRSPLTNQMYAGVLAMSGIFKSTKGAARGHILMGLSDDQEFREIYTAIDGAKKRSSTPACIYTGRPGAGKTQHLLQIASQVRYQGDKVFFMNPKRDQTLKPFFDLIGGVTINMSAKYLRENPGLNDPTLYFEDRDQVASIISDNIISAMRIDEERGVDSASRVARIRAEVKEHSNMPQNKTTHDIIFGNERYGTPSLSDEQVVEMINNKIKESPFWISFVGFDPDANREMVEAIHSGAPILVEWDSSMNLPDVDDLKNNRLSDRHIDSIMSVTTTFVYAAELLGNGKGGLLEIDEAWTLKASPQAMSIIERGSREWRAANIMLVLATQRIVDFFDDQSSNDLRAYFSRMLFMAINPLDEADFQKFFEITGLPDNLSNRSYMINAGVKPLEDEDGNIVAESKKIPNAYYVDSIYDYEGGIICGPWPKRELNVGRTDLIGEEDENMMAFDEDTDSGLSDIVSQHFGTGSFGQALMDDNKVKSLLDVDEDDLADGAAFLEDGNLFKGQQ